MAAKRDYYEVLGVARDADRDAIKRSYRKLAMQFHPDKNPGDMAAEESFKEASEAYEVLSDDQKRGQYDRFGHAATQGQTHASDINDIFSQFSSIFEEMGFESFFGGARGQQQGGQRRRGGQRGSDLRVKLKLTLEEISTGVEKKIKLKKQIPCDQCNGSGAYDMRSLQNCPTCRGAGEVRQQVGGGFFSQIVVQMCPTCGGDGRVITKTCQKCAGDGRMEGEEVLALQVPPGVAEGMQLSLRAQGNIGKRGGPAGDLILQIEEAEHEHLLREGDNLIYELYLNIADAALGTTVDTPTLDGKSARFKVEPGTQSGEIKRLKGKGLPNVNGNRIGDMLVHIHVWTPKKLNAEERRVLEKLRQLPNFAPSPTRSEKSFVERMREFFS